MLERQRNSKIQETFRESHLPALSAIAKLQPSLKKSHGIEIKSRAHLVVSRLKRVWGRLVKFVGDRLFTRHKNFIFFSQGINGHISSRVNERSKEETS